MGLASNTPRHWFSIPSFADSQMQAPVALVLVLENRVIFYIESMFAPPYLILPYLSIKPLTHWSILPSLIEPEQFFFLLLSPEST